MAQYEDLIVDQGSDVEIKLELFNPDGSRKILNKYNQATNTLIPLFSANGKIKKSFNSKDSDSTSFGTYSQRAFDYCRFEILATNRN